MSDIVITGTGLITSLGKTRDEIWRAVAAGRCGIGPMSAMESPVPSGANGGQAVDLLADFSADLPRDARYLRRAILDATLESFGERPPYSADRCGIMIGTTLHGMRSAGDFLRSGNFDHLKKFLAGQTLQLALGNLPINGFTATTCSACSSSLGSIALGITLLESGKYDLIIAGGYDAISEYVYGGFNSLRLVSDDALRPFSRNRSGMKLAEGYGIVVLERADDAAKRNVSVLGKILGWGESADAHHLTQPHPQGIGAATAMSQALDRAGLKPEQIDLIAAHATGTPDNDAAEHAALAQVFESRLKKIPVVGFKSHLGHTLGGAGAVELILSMMAIKNQTIPPCANLSDDECEFPDLRVTNEKSKSAAIATTLNTSLGFGGANTSIVLGSKSSSIARRELRDVFITGVGVICPGVLNNVQFLERLNHPEIPAWNRDRSQISDSDLENLLSARRVRRMSEYVKLQLAAATLAARDAKISDMPAFAENCSAILGTMHGSVNYSENYYSQIVREGISAANPMLFAEGVPNAAAAQLSLMFGIKGSCQTIIGTRTSGLDALNLATARIATGAWDRAIIGAGEEFADIVERAYQHCGLAATSKSSAPFDGENGFTCGSGAVAMILESQNSLEQRQAFAKARVVDWAAVRSWKSANIFEKLGDVDAVLSSACGTWIDRVEAAAIRKNNRGVTSAIYGHAPEVFSAGPLIAISAAILGKKVPRLLGPFDGRAATGEESIRTLAAIATDFTGCAAATKIEVL